MPKNIIFGLKFVTRNVAGKNSLFKTLISYSFGTASANIGTWPTLSETVMLSQMVMFLRHVILHQHIFGIWGYVFGI